jgi:hypothetical protein
MACHFLIQEGVINGIKTLKEWEDLRYLFKRMS